MTSSLACYGDIATKTLNIKQKTFKLLLEIKRTIIFKFTRLTSTKLLKKKKKTLLKASVKKNEHTRIIFVVVVVVVVVITINTCVWNNLDVFTNYLRKMNIVCCNQICQMIFRCIFPWCCACT